MAGQKHTLVYVARHGTTTLNQKDAFRGPIDADLDAQGRRDAHQVAHYMGPVELSYIFHSDMSRTRETAKIICAEHEGIDLQACPDLRAWNVGDLGGKPKSPENLAIVEYHVLHPEIPLPGGESLDTFKGRVQPIIQEAIDKAVEIGVPLLLVAHSSVIHEVGMMVAGDHGHCLVDPGGVCAIYVCKDKLDATPIFKSREKEPPSGEAIT